MRIRISAMVIVALLSLCTLRAQAQQNQSPQKGKMGDTSLVERFYAAMNKHIVWYDVTTQSMSPLQERILKIVDSVTYYGLDREDYTFPKERAINLSENKVLHLDTLFTRTLIKFATDLYSGANIKHYISSDELSNLYKTKNDSFILAWLLKMARSGDLSACLSILEPNDSAYLILKAELRQQLDSGNSKEVNELNESINIYRWIKHFRMARYIVVNIPEATLRLYEEDTVRLKMSVVVGKPSTRTPRIATWCNKVVLYPYWNVPASIARKELLPLFKKSLSKIREMNMQIIGSKGNIIDPATLDWTSFNRSYFPYTVRQCTGCDNALGVIKFNLTDPFNVYMHDTNYKLAFMSDHRYLSHGCIRVSKPIDLGNCLLDNKLDADFLAACIKNQEPIEMKIKTAVPVFVVYMTATSDHSSVKYFKDIYHLLK